MSVPEMARVYDFMAYKAKKTESKIGEVIKVSRLDRGKNQEDLGNEIHKSAACVSRWENGSRQPDPKDVADITLALNDRRPAEAYCNDCPVAEAWRKVTDHLRLA